MKNIALILLILTIISCGSQKQQDAQDATGNSRLGPGCEELENVIDSLNDEIANLKHKRRNREATATSPRKTQSAESADEESAPAFKAPAPVSKPKAVAKKAFKRDSDGSMRCIFAGCKKRTYYANGLCWQHGGY